ncbi:hypothetical protein D1AOALGA4SA_6118 [Olavius algarvensis Delta 1 endosymbiont]|nr:hypothetical protein D1AOALGA4SA_6118 [Olavius algarvensis Delta 1 endosymbiont]
MKKVKFIATPKHVSLPKEIFEFSFDDNDIQLLNLYYKNFEKLKNSDFLLNEIPYFKKMRFTAEKGMQFEFSEYNYDDIYEFLHLARPFFLFREPASFKKICGIFGRKSAGTNFSQHIKYLGSLYNNGVYQPYFQFSVGQDKLFHDDNIQLWLNGEEYHQDLKKSQKVEALKDALGVNSAKSFFATQLSGRIETIYMLENLVEIALK